MNEDILKDFDRLKQKVAHENDIKLIEAISKTYNTKEKRSIWENPILPIIFSALLGTAGIIAGKIYDTNQANKNRSKELERDLIVKAIETTNPQVSRDNLKLLANAKLISDPDLVSGIENLMKDSIYNFRTLEAQKAIGQISQKVENISQEQEKLDSLVKALLAQNSELQKKSKETEESNGKLLTSVVDFQKEIQQLKQKSSPSMASEFNHLGKTSAELESELKKQAYTIQQQQQQQKQQYKGLNQIQQKKIKLSNE